MTRTGWGVLLLRGRPTIHVARGFEVPAVPGVIDHVVNDTGAPTPPGTVPVNQVRYPVV